MTQLAALLIAGLAFGLLSGLREVGPVSALPGWYWGALAAAALPPVAFHLVTRGAAAPTWNFASVFPLTLVTYLWFDLPAQALKVQAITQTSDPGDPASLTRLAWIEGAKLVLVSGLVVAWTLRQSRAK